MAVSFAQPTDVVKVRFQAQMNLSGVARRYSGTMQAYKQIYQLEGFRGLWKGASPFIPCCQFILTRRSRSRSLFRAGTLPNITRNALVNCTELVTYDLIKEAILRHNLLSGERRCYQYARTHPPTVIADWAETNTPTQAFNSAAADKRATVHEDTAHTGQLVHKLMIHLIHSVAFCSLRGEGGDCVTRLTRLTQRSSLI